MTKPILSQVTKDCIDIALIIGSFAISPIFGSAYLFIRIQIYMVTRIAQGFLINKRLVQEAKLIREEAERIRAEALSLAEQASN